jgi:mono/diheme cytochrome c family protein
MRRDQLKAALIITSFIAVVAVSVTAGGGRGASLGEDIFYNSSPACVACHNARRGDLAFSRMPPNEMAYWIRNGIDDRMPGYRLNDQQMDALIRYLMELRRR